MTTTTITRDIAGAGTTASYRRALTRHPTHGIAVLIPLGLAFTVDACAFLGVVLAVEVCVLVLLPRVPFVRKAVDADAAIRAEIDAQEARSALLAQMSAAHQRELVELDGIARSLESRFGGSKEAEVILGWRVLLALYAELAVLHNTATELLRRTQPRVSLEDEATQLERQADAEPAGTRTRLAQRVSVLRQRSCAQRWAADELRAIEVDLATIADSVRLLEERVAARTAASVRSDVAMALAAIPPLDDELLDLLPPSPRLRFDELAAR